MEKINKEDIISIKNINKKFNDKIVFKDFQIDFYKNQINCIIGKSGCGKSTLLNIISGIIFYYSHFYILIIYISFANSIYLFSH